MFLLFLAANDQIAQLNAGVEADLREALNNDQLFLEYQPIVDTANGQYVRVGGTRALASPCQGKACACGLHPCRQ